MRKNYVPYIISILFITAVLLIITLLTALIYGAVMSVLGSGFPPFFRTEADALFLAGGIALTSGAFVEFFWKGISNALAKRIMGPYGLISGEASGPYAGGWMLIFSGALLAIFSVAFAFMAIK